ncbi:MAG: hypothetical protein E7231_09115 [Cellulosilyticum sp.]|nr:hypothetical protein [Cellulosilyticum sp.]
MKESLFRPKILERERINKLLEAIFETPLFYLSASMGYGKTTAIRCFLESKKDVRTVWMPISSKSEDEKWLWQKFVESTKKYSSSLIEEILNIGFPENDYKIRQVLDLIDEIIEEPLVLVFDDYHDTKCPLVDRILSIYTEYNMKNIHVVVISRMRPTAEFLMLNIKNKCMLMWQGEIAFTKEETRELFELNGFILTEQELDELYNHAMGWVAHTYLVLLEYAAHQHIGIVTGSTEIIKNAVYNQLDEASQKTLRMLAPIERFTLELGEYITGNQRVNSVIQNMMMNNCFINLIPQTKEYQFHALFRHALLDELKKSEINEKDILNKCGQWYRMQGDIIQALGYFDQARNDEAILEIMSETRAVEYIDIAPKLMVTIFSHISLEKKLSYPMGYLTFIHSYLWSSQSNTAKKMLEEAKSYYLEHPEIENWKHIMGEIYLIESFNQIGNGSKILEAFKKAYEHLEGGHSRIAGPYMICTRGNLQIGSLFYKKIGGYKEVIHLMVANLSDIKHIVNGCTAGMKYLVKAEYAYNTGNLEEAKILAHKSIYKAETKQQIAIILDDYFILARISFIEGNLEEMEQYIVEIEKRAIVRRHPTIHMSIDMIKAYLYGISGQYQKIPESIRKFDMEKGIEGLPSVDIAAINLGVALLRKKEYIQLEVIMEAKIEEYKKQQALYNMIYAYILSAIAKLQLYDEDEGLEVLEEALKIAEPDQIIMPFIEYREEIRTLLSIIAKENDFATSILDYQSTSNHQIITGVDSNQGIVDLLTDREKDVMRFFVKGHKQSEVARELQISIDTVKRHIKNVYSKLDIHSKAELVEKLGQNL